MKPILNIVFSFLLFLIGPVFASATDVCPNETEWVAIKYRVFYSKLFQIAGRCYPHSYVNNQRTHSTAEGPRVDQASMKLTGDCNFRPFHVDQMRIASEYFDRRYPGADRVGSYSDYGTCRRSSPTGEYNKRWDSYETDLLNKVEGQIYNVRSTPAIWQSYCAEAIETIDQILQMESSDEIPDFIEEHPFAREHDLPECDNGNGAITRNAISLDSTTAVDAARADQDAPTTADTDTNPDSEVAVQVSQDQGTPPQDSGGGSSDTVPLSTGAGNLQQPNPVAAQGPISLLPIQSPNVRAAALGIDLIRLRSLYINTDDQGRCRPNYTPVSESNNTIRCAPLSLPSNP